ncbi:MAG TPA: hypothetical protein VJQ45_00685 [Ktedonobacterales bacterium]|nr:hypothetical protein [Ktedonobacterales bacterium]
MARAQREGVQVAAVLAELDAAEDQPLREACTAWAAASPRFRTFLAEHATKIARKLRTAEGFEGRRDVLLELYAAHRLLLDRSVTLEYERYAADKTRGPDFTATFKTHTPFNVEVRRLRGATGGDFGRWASVIGDKLRQMPPSIANALLVGCDANLTPALDVAEAMARLRTLAERHDDEFFARRGLPSAKDYLRQLQRLSAIVLVAGWEGTPAGMAALWLNPQAKHPLPRDLSQALARW